MLDDVEHAAAPAFDHAWKKQTGQVRERGDVDLNHFELPLERQFGKRAVRAESGVVDQNVHHDSPALQFLEHARRGFGPGKIGGQNERFDFMRLAQFTGQGFQRVGVAGEQY